MKVFKIFFKVIIAIVIILFLALTIFLLTFDLNRFRPTIVQKASEALGRSVTIEDMSMKISLIPTVAVKGVKVGNPANFDRQEPMAQIDEMDVTLALLPLLSGNVELKDFNLSSAKIALVQKGNQNNWTFGDAAAVQKEVKVVPATPASDPADLFSKLKVDNISIKQLTVSYAQDGKVQTILLSDATIKQLQLFSMTIVYDGKPVKLSGNLGDIAKILAKKPNYTFSLDAEAFDMTAKISGAIGDTKSFEKILLNATISGNNLARTVQILTGKTEQIPGVSFSLSTVVKGDIDGEIKLEPLSIALDSTKMKLDANVMLKDIQKDISVTAIGSLDLADAKLAARFGVKPMSTRFNVRATKEFVSFNSIEVNANKSDVKVNGSVSLKDKVPDLIVSIASEYLDVNDFVVDKPMTQGVSAGASKKSSPLFSSEKIDLSALKMANAKVNVNAKNIKIPDLDYIGLTMASTLNGGDLNVDSLNVRTVAGNISGNGRLNASAEPAVANMKLEAQDLKLNTFKPVTEHLKDSMVSANVNLTTHGESVKSFVQALNGQIVIELSEGKIVDKWFNSLPATIGMIKNKTSKVSFSSTDQVSELVCGAINLTVKNGVITSNNQIAIETSAVNFAVSGDINLPQERLSLTMVPSMPSVGDKWQDALALTQIVKISGPFDDLKPSVDAKAATEQIAKIGLEKLADRLAEKKGINLPIQTSTSKNDGYNLCEKALGRPLKGHTQNRIVPQAPQADPAQREAQKPTEKLDPKDQFKQQLFNSLNEALKK